MSIAATVRNSLDAWLTRNSPAHDDAIRKLIDSELHQLPADYLDLLRIVDGGETWLGDPQCDNSTYLVLWATHEVLRFNDEYGLAEFAPSFFAIGGNGGGELFAFDKRRMDDAIFMVPTIGMSDECGLPISESLAEFLQPLAKNDG